MTERREIFRELARRAAAEKVLRADAEVARKLRERKEA